MALLPQLLLLQVLLQGVTASCEWKTQEREMTCDLR